MRRLHRIASTICLAVLLPSVAGAAGSDRELRFPVRTLNMPMRDLRFPMTDTVAVCETPQEIRIELPADILFDFDKAVIREDARPAIATAARLLRAHLSSTVQIAGHADAKGTDTHNQPLSQRRAEAVRSWLAQQENVRLAHVSVAGFGSRQPVAPNSRPDGTDDPDGRQRNRRVEIVIDKLS